MKIMFKQAALLRKNTREIRDRLRALGYDLAYIKERPETWGWATGAGHAILINPEHFADWTDAVPHAKRIDCGENEMMFFALVALSDNTDRQQWFVLENTEIVAGLRVVWDICHDDANNYGDFPNLIARKATAAEIVEHFNKTIA